MKKITRLIIFSVMLISISSIVIYANTTSISDIETTFEAGPISEVPWENNPVFQETKTKNNTLVLLSAYRSVLKNPLPGEETNVSVGAKKLCGLVLEPGETFSQNKILGPYTVKNGYEEGRSYYKMNVLTTIGGGVCKVASTLYNVAVSCNLDIIERHNHTMPVPYVPYGQDAAVSIHGKKDFKFVNNTSEPIMIWAEGIGNVLYVAFYGTTKPPVVTWQHQILKINKSKVTYKDNNTIPVGNETVLVEGMDGVDIESWAIVKYADGKIETKELGISKYKPLNSLIERGTKK